MEKFNEIKTRYNKFFDRAWMIELSSATRDEKDQIAENLGGYKHWMEIYNRSQSEEVRQVALELIEESAIELEKVISETEKGIIW